ncbi:GntR family transcriptional regulator [Lactobacillus sp. ESL0684]|uniref:GntR family transcriptional regulator n=1 Tax=Lactobacillus sp. ESL0684 TaxID=2983213 RepID=UPI0023F6FC51|nr:GntR family transcriptional regulator [Lactobacillus sp. ESL0684]WEV43613.1 GntR family transcriptional regulator [Lactobacillus sp. ESL0684]
MTKYIDIATTLKQRINSGQYKAGTSLPQQKTLAKEFNTSRMTIQKALDVLDNEGLIYRVQGSGIYVKKNINFLTDMKIPGNQYFGATHLFGKSHHVKSKIITFNISNPTKEAQNALKVTYDQAVYNIVRLRLVDDISYALEYTTMPTQVIPGINQEVLLDSIYNYIQNNLNLTIGSAYRTISADKPDQLDQQYLNCLPVDPILQVQQIVYLDDGVAFEFSRTRQRFDKGKYTIFEAGHPNL